MATRGGLLIAMLFATPVNAEDSPFSMASAVSEAELASQRGGMTLPNGVDVALTAQIDTALDGTLILRSVLEIAGGQPSVQVYAPAPGTTGPAYGAPRSIVAAPAAGPQFTIDGRGNVTGIGSAPGLPGGQVAVIVGVGEVVGGAPEGLLPLPLAAGAPAVQTSAGLVSLTTTNGNTRVNLDGHSLDVVHLLGGALGTVTANTANNATIESATLINLQLGNTGAISAASRTLRAQDVALDAVRLGVR